MLMGFLSLTLLVAVAVCRAPTQSLLHAPGPTRVDPRLAPWPDPSLLPYSRTQHLSPQQSPPPVPWCPVVSTSGVQILLML